MKVVAVREAKQQLSGRIDRAQKERVLITRRGKPAALVIGVQGQDLEEVLLMQNPLFWELIEKRRKRPTVSLAEIRKRFRLSSKRKP
jgi:prevent-host-death family protein